LLSSELDVWCNRGVDRAPNEALVADADHGEGA
jgi:hypothetical protein